MKILGLMSALLWLGAAMAGGAEAWQLLSGAKDGRGAGLWSRLVLPEETAGKQNGDAIPAEADAVLGGGGPAGGDGDAFGAWPVVAHDAWGALIACRVRLAVRGESSGIGRTCELVAGQHPERGPPAPPTTGMA